MRDLHEGDARLLARRARAISSYARQVVAELEEKRKTEYVSPVELAQVHIALGNTEKALDWIERAVDERRGWAAYLRVHPILDPVRDEPRFAQLVERMKFDTARLLDLPRAR